MTTLSDEQLKELDFLIQKALEGMKFRNTLLRNSYGVLKAVGFEHRFGICSITNSQASLAGGFWIDHPTPQIVQQYINTIERHMDEEKKDVERLGYKISTYGAYSKDTEFYAIRIAHPLHRLVQDDVISVMAKKRLSFSNTWIGVSHQGLVRTAILLEIDSFSLEGVSNLTPEEKELLITSSTLELHPVMTIEDDRWDWGVMKGIEDGI